MQKLKAETGLLVTGIYLMYIVLVLLNQFLQAYMHEPKNPLAMHSFLTGTLFFSFT